MTGANVQRNAALLADAEHMTRAELAAKYGISTERVRQLTRLSAAPTLKGSEVEPGVE